MKRTESFSYFKPDVKNTIPLMETTLNPVYSLIRSYRLKETTEKIRLGLASKTRDLPSACFSGTFKSRGIAGLLHYSGLICLDVDELDFAPSLKERLSKDAFLNPVLLFISPRGHGLKIIIRVKDGAAEKHGLYFDALARYLKGAHGIEIDSSGRDISRLCFLCHDPEPFWFEDGFVSAEALLRLLPRTTETKTETPASVSAGFVEALKTRFNTCRDARFCVSGNQLNRTPAVHELAVEALKRHGWKQKGDLWTRAGKEISKGCSAKFNLYPPEGIHILYNFSSNAQPFLRNKGYTDCQVICELDYGGNFRKCISELAKTFLDEQTTKRQHDHTKCEFM